MTKPTEEEIDRQSILLTPAQKAAIRWPSEEDCEREFHKSGPKEFYKNWVCALIKHALRDLIDE